MKANRRFSIVATALLAALALPVQAAAQHHHYKFIDLGTIGGAPSLATATQRRTALKLNWVLKEA